MPAPDATTLRPPELLAGERVRLRRSTAADYTAVFPAASDPEVMRLMDWPAHRSVDETREFFAGVRARWDAGEDFHWIIEPIADGAFVGCLGLRIDGHAADFGYFLARAQWGRGHAGAAVALLVQWLLQQPSILRIWATTDSANLRSRRVLERAGLQYEGTLRMATFRPNIGGPPRDKDVFARVRMPTPARPPPPTRPPSPTAPP